MVYYFDFGRLIVIVVQSSQMGNIRGNLHFFSFTFFFKPLSSILLVRVSNLNEKKKITKKILP